MDTGHEKQQSGWKQKLDAIAADPRKLRLYLVGGILAVAYFLVVGPFAERLQAAHAKLEHVHVVERRATALEHYNAQEASYGPLVHDSSDDVDWQDYVLAKINDAGTVVKSTEPRKTTRHGTFQVVEIKAKVAAQAFEQIVDLIDRLERGERIIRIESITISPREDAIELDMLLRGLSKARRATPAERGDG